MAEFLLNSLVGYLRVDRLTEFLKRPIQRRAEVAGQQEEREKLHQLGVLLESVKKELENAEGGRFKDIAARVWIERLEEIAYEMEDLMEEWKFRMLAEEKSAINVFASFLSFKHVPDVSLRVMELNQRVDDLFYKTRSGGASDGSDHEFSRQPSIPDLDESEVYGRESEKESLIPLLLQVSNNGVQVISILGNGGGGKTTLAQCLFNDKRVESHFQIKKWVCISHHFDAKRIAQTLADDPDEESLESLLETVKTCFSGKRFLLVLDDVWNEDKSKWEPFWRSLKDGAPGSMIMVTTISKTVAREVGTDHEHFLRPLQTKDCWLILKQIALSGKPQSLSKEVKSTAMKFAKQCKGSPLIAQIAGGLLQELSPQDWDKTLDMEIWKNEEFAIPLYRHLYVSYKKLSPQLKTCFSYCAVFPRDTCIDVERLVRLLISSGYVSDPSSEKPTQKLGGYAALERLENMSFLTDAKRSVHKNKITSYKIPDICLSFAEYIRPDLTMLGQQRKSDHQETRSMRSFIILSPRQLPQGLFKKMRFVRALVLSCCELEELPSDVACLNFLRFLDLSANPLKELPETICMMLCLKSLYLQSCFQLMSLPQRIGDLDLKHLRINYTTDELHNLPLGFEKLTSIQTLDVFRIGGRYNNVQRLKNLNDLEDIRIAVHGDVNFPDADLESKNKLENLELCFVGEGRDQEKAICIEKLVPPPNLGMLKLEDYPRLKLPRWILSESLINNLKRLSLRSAPNISHLPALWKLSSLEFLWLYDIPNLTHLGREFIGLPRSNLHQNQSENEIQKTWISYLHNSSDVDEDEEMIEDDEDEQTETVGEITSEEIGERATIIVAFRSLKTLRIEYLENWKLWEDHVDEVGDKKLKPRLVMPSLEEMIISNCPMLNVEALPNHILGKISSLKILVDGKPADIKSDSKGKKVMAEPED